MNALLDEIQSLVATNDSLTRIVQGDDCIELEAELIDSRTKKRLALVTDFLDRMKATNASFTVTHYFSESLVQYVTPQAYCALSDKKDYRPIFKLYCKIDSDTVIEYSQNKLSIRIHKLSHFTQNRFKTLVRAILNCGLFEYKHRTELSQKRLYNAARQTLLRRFYIRRYEWCLIFNPDISAVIYPNLHAISSRIHGNTFYLHDTPRSQCKVKVYNIDAANRGCRAATEFKQGEDRLKFEITYKHEFFRRHDSLTIRQLTNQNAIATLLYDSNKKMLERFILDRLNCADLKALLTVALVETKGKFMDIFQDTDTTHFETDRRLAEIERKIKLLQETTDNNTARIDDNIIRLAKLEALFGYSETMQDKRKMRLVKS